MTSTSPGPLAELLERFTQAGQSECAAFGSATWSYADLLKEIAQDEQALIHRDIRPRAVVVTTGEFCLRHLSFLFALGKLGCVNVPLPELQERELSQGAEIANATHVIDVGREGQWSLRPTGQVVTNSLLGRFLVRKEAGLIVFTSGSTGEKKAILHNLSKLLVKFLTPRKPFCAISFLKLDHLGGINTVLHILSNSGKLVFPRLRTIDEVCRLIQSHRVNLLPTTPSFLRLLLLSDCHRQYDLSSLEVITYGTELMPTETLRRLRERFPTVQLQQTFGLSELGVLRAKSLSPDSLWVKVGGEGYQTQVVEGRLWIKAEAAMEGYLNQQSPFSEDGWFDTGDKVEVQGEYIRFLGRESEIINVAGEKVFPAEVENFLLRLPNVKDALVSSEPNRVVGNIITATIVLLNPESEEEARTRIKKSCQQAMKPFMVPVKIAFVSELEYSDRYKKSRGRSNAPAAARWLE